MAIVLPSPKAPIENGRVLERVDKPFVYGTAAFWQGKTESQNSHKWTVYVRGLENEDLSYYIKSVTFQLHTSFDQSTREIFEAPYEVTEFGWGEFTIGITIKFHDEANEDPITLQHQLKLFPPPGITPSTKKPVMSEQYDEFVFVHPTLEWWRKLHSSPLTKMDNHHLMPFFTTPQFAKDEDASIAKLQQVNESIQHQIDVQRSKLFLLEQEIQQLTQNL